MPGFNVILKSNFFDRAAVVNAMDRATNKALSKAGAFVRTRARSSIRKRKKISDPGKPPNSHVGTLRDKIFFAYDKASRSVVVGPQPFARGQAPHNLEFGGKSTIVSKGVKKVVTIKPRPFMGPALLAETEAGNIPQAWAGTFGE